MIKVEIIVCVAIALALLTEVVYVWAITRVKKSMKPIKHRRIVYVKPVKMDRPELDFDLGVKKVDKLRFGDEP